MRRFQPITTLVLPGLLLAASLPPASSVWATEVLPGVGTLQAAIDAASPGQQLDLHGGTYTGPVVVSKSLKITCVGPEACDVDANCEAAIALDIAADGVVLRTSGNSANFDIFRGTTTQIRVADHHKVELRSRVNVNSAPMVPCGTEQNGIEVSGTSSKVKLVDVRAIGSPGAGVLLANLAARANVQIKLYFGVENGVGVSMQNSADGAALGRSGLVIDKSAFVGNDVGVQLASSDGVRIKRSNFAPGSASPGAIGISLDSTSDANLIVGCGWSDQTMSNSAYLDAGTGNCGKHNQFSVPVCQ